MLVWNGNKRIEMQIGDKVFVGRCGSGRTVFGEYAILERTTKNYLVFKTNSGGTIKTAIDNLRKVAGKAHEQFWFVSTILDRDFIQYPFHTY